MRKEWNYVIAIIIIVLTLTIITVPNNKTAISMQPKSMTCPLPKSIDTTHKESVNIIEEVGLYELQKRGYNYNVITSLYEESLVNPKLDMEFELYNVLMMESLWYYLRSACGDLGVDTPEKRVAARDVGDQECKTHCTNEHPDCGWVFEITDGHPKKSDNQGTLQVNGQCPVSDYQIKGTCTCTGFSGPTTLVSNPSSQTLKEIIEELLGKLF